MKLLNAFFILIIGAVIHPSMGEIEEVRKAKETLPFMAIIHASDTYFNFYKSALILTENWLLSTFNVASYQTYDIYIEVYSDLFTVNKYEYEIDSYKSLEILEKNLYPSFNLIKLKSSIIFGDSRKPIPLAGPNYKWREGQEATAYYFLSHFVDKYSEPHEYFKSLPVKVITDEKIYESSVSSLLQHSEAKFVEFLCNPAILNGVLVGFDVQIEGVGQFFLKISSIYDWILHNVPELSNSKYQLPDEGNSIILTDKIINANKSLLDLILGLKQSNFSQFVYVNNVSIHVNAP